MEMRRLRWLAVALITATGLAAVGVSALARALAPPRDPAAVRAAGRAPGLACPAEAPRKLVSARVGADSQLVPGTPSSALVCSYNGFSEPGTHLAGFTLLGELALPASYALSLAVQFNALPQWPPYAVFACPSDEGRVAVVYFRYASGASDPVLVNLQGCSGSSNGHASREGFPPKVGAVHGSAAFVGAHQGWVVGTVQQCRGPAPARCVPLSGGVRVLAANGDWNGTASLHDGVFAQRATPGRDRVQYARGWLSGNPKAVRQAWATVRGGRTTDVTLRLPVP